MFSISSKSYLISRVLYTHLKELGSCALTANYIWKSTFYLSNEYEYVYIREKDKKTKFETNVYTRMGWSFDYVAKASTSTGWYSETERSLFQDSEKKDHANNDQNY